jgi:colanic acid/amylovoran biosynthesis glycosyltransferase
VNSNSAQPRMKYLNIVSIFPTLTETFVLRELRAMRQMGCEVMIGQLRPIGRRPAALGFDDLNSCVVRAKVLSWAALIGLAFFALKKPSAFWSNLKLALSAIPDITNTAKLLYILVASTELAYRFRQAGITHVRGHHLHSEAVSAMLIGGLLDVPYSFTCHTVKIYYPKKVVVEVVRGARFIIASIIQVRGFLYSLGATGSQVCLIRNGVSPDQFPMRASEPASEPPVILAVGRMDYKKGFHVLLSACAILRDESVSFCCVIVGGGEEWSDLSLRRRTLGLEKHVEMTGSLDFENVQSWYERAALVVVPSVVGPDGATDGLPTVIIEAFFRGVPVVGSTTAGIPEVIQNGVNGFVVAAGSARELANRMRELLSNHDLRRKFALEARHTAARYFDLDRNAQCLAELMSGQVPDLVSEIRPALVSSAS